MSNSANQTNQLPELLPTSLGTKIGVFVGAAVLGAYGVALLAQAANVI
ncbi:MAG: hypothetical protein AAFY01_00775 [Pseudomonadota bacterium]